MGKSDREAASLGPAEGYERHVGRYGGELAKALIAVTGIRRGMRVLDVGCGPGALTVALAELLGGESVSAIDPSERMVETCRARVPAAQVVIGVGEELPFADAEFDAVLAQLVLNHMSDAPKGVAEMRRVAHRGGVVAASVWDFASGMTMLRTFWDAALSVDPAGAAAAGAGTSAAFCDPDQLRGLWEQHHLGDVQVGALLVKAEHSDFDDFWAPFAAGVGGSGRYCTSLDETTRRALREEVHRRLGAPKGPFDLAARAWYVRGLAPA
jgi:SAM-dependent methyltransferase